MRLSILLLLGFVSFAYAAPPAVSSYALEVREGDAPPVDGWARITRDARGLSLEQSWPSRLELRLVANEQGVLSGAVPLSDGVTQRLEGEGRDTRLELRLRQEGDGYAGAWRIRGAAGTLRQGHATWRATTQGLSPLAASIYAAVQPVASRGTVPAGSVFSRGRPEPQALVRGPSVFGRMADLIRSAEHEVLFLTYTWEAECGPSLRIVDALRDLAARRRETGGAPIRAWFMVNGGWFAKRTAIKSMRRDLDSLGLAPYVDVRLVRHKHRLFGALHTKSLVVDGKVALVSGANPEAKHDGEDPWYDLGFVVRGQAAYSAREDFAHAWQKIVGEALPEIEIPAAHPDDVPVWAISRKGQGNLLKRSIQDPQGQAYLAAIKNAQRSIRILTPNLNYAPIRDALAQAAARGVHVQLVLSFGFNRDAENRPFQGGHNERNSELLREHARQLSAPAVDLRWYSADGQARHVGNGPGASHAKYLSVDGQVVLAGSTNLDTQSFVHSRELDFLVDDSATTAAWDAQVFLPVWERAIKPE